MKRIFLFSFCLFSIFSYAQPVPKLYIFLASHNEDNIGYLNGTMGHNRYIANRAALVNVCAMVQAKGMKYNWGSDHIALRAIAQFDTGSVLTATNGKNLCRWMTEDMGVVCDPHSHEVTYNYADVAYLMSLLGVTPSNTMSGFLYDQLQSGHSWEEYQTPHAGDSFPAYSWAPQFIWGAGSPSHVNDPLYFGVYRPTSMASFSTHTSTNHLIYVGTGCQLKLKDTVSVAEAWAVIKNDINAIQSGVLPANGIYMQEIMYSEGDVAMPWFFPLLDALTDSVNTLISAGTAEWKNIADIGTEWLNNFGNQPFAADCGYNIIMQPTGVEETISTDGISIYPNPATKSLVVSGWLLENEEKRTVEISDIYGRLLLTQNSLPNTQYDISNLPAGIYLLRLKNAGTEKVFPFVKE